MKFPVYSILSSIIGRVARSPFSSSRLDQIARRVLAGISLRALLCCAASALPPGRAVGVHPCESSPPLQPISTAHSIRSGEAREIAFIDFDLADVVTLAASGRAGVEIVLLDPATDELAQISAHLAKRGNIAAVHIVSHGEPGAIRLGRARVDAARLAREAAQFSEWRRALAPGGDILLYGCEVAAGSEGRRFMDALAQATGADIAASTDLTGAANRGGNWTLEAWSGDIATRALAIDAYHGLLTVVTITDTDADYSRTSFTKTVNGRTLTFSNASNSLGMDTTYGAGTPGLYAYEGAVNGSDIKLTIGIETGYTFDISSFMVGVASGTLSIQVTYGDGSTESFSQNGLNNSWQTLSGFNSASTTINDIRQIVLTSLDFALFQDFDIIDVKAIVSVPTVTDARISITSTGSGPGGGYKIGDTITAAWNNTAGGDNNSGVTGVTMDFSPFGGGAAVAATNSSGTWSASYTIVAGGIDGTNKNVSVSATSSGGTTTTADTSNLTVDNIAPTVTDANISISGASGTGGAFKIGDTVTATWNNTAGGDNNSDTIAGVTVDFSQFGGGAAVAATNSSGTWTATYTLVAGAINNATNRNVAVTATDNAGNSKTTADTTNATVDNVAPSLTFGSLAFSADTGTSASDFITNTASQTITATLSGAPAGSDTVMGSLDNGSTWTDVTSKVSGSTLTWNGVTLTSSSTLKLKITDAAGNDGGITSQAYTLDTSAPGAPSTPDMTSGTDSGTSSSDNITSDNTPTFTGTAESGSIVTLYDTDGTTVLGTATAAGGNWSITSSAVSSGSHTMTARATDIAGNSSSASSGLSVTIDIAAPSSLALSTTTIATQNATSTSTISTLSATDSQSITFSLAVGNGTNDADNGSFTISGTALKVGGASLAGGTYKIYVSATDVAGNVANQAFTITIVDAPSVSSIVRTGGASSTVSTSATSVQYTVTFSESVTGVDSSDFSLTATGTAAGNIAGVSGSGTTYSVTVDTLSGDGTLRLDLNSSGTGIKNGSNVDIASGYTSGSTYTLDHTAPNSPSTPDMTSGTDSGTSSSDNTTNDDTPTFTGTAESGSTVTLYDTDGTTVLGAATATGGNWSITAAALSAGSHTVTAKANDAAGNVSAASSGLVVIIDPAAPTVSSVSVPSNGSYKAGQTLSFTVNTSEAVTVDTSGGTPRLALTIGSSTVYAVYASGSGSSALVFTYSVQAGDTDPDGIAISSLQSNGGTLNDTAGNSLNLTLNSVGSTTSVLVDTTAATVSSVSVPANGTYYSNQNLDFTVNFSEAVTVNTTGGTPRIALTLDTGGTVYATYLSGSGTSALVFRYTVADGVQDTNGVSVGALGANGGTLQDAAGNDAILTLNSVGSTASVNVDGTQPRVQDVTSTTANDTYNAGDTISITVTFTKAVTVDTTGGTPTLALNSGGSASYSSGSGSATLVFTYTIGTGQNSADLDYTSTSALALNGGTIKDSGGLAANAILTLSAPGAAGSLGVNKAIVVDTTAPFAVGINRQNPQTINTAASTATWRITFSDDVTGVDANDFALTVISGTASGTVATANAVDASTYDIVVNAITGYGGIRLDLKASSTGIADLAGNPISGGFTDGESYLVGATNVFDTLGLSTGTSRSVSNATANKIAQRFTTSASSPLSVTTVTAALGSISGSPTPVVTINADASGIPGSVIATLTNPASLTANALNTWSGSTLLAASTTYWIVFADSSSTASYAIKETAATSGGTGAWLTTPDYIYFHGTNAAVGPQPGALQIALGAASLPAITSSLAASATYGTAITPYTITGSASPTSFQATGLPSGLTVNSSSGTIAGTPTQAGTFNVALSAANDGGTGTPSTLVLTVAKAPLAVTAGSTSRIVGQANPTFTVSYSGFVNGDTAGSLATAPTASTTATISSPVGAYPITASGGVSSNYSFSYIDGVLTINSAPINSGGGAGGGVIPVVVPPTPVTIALAGLTTTYDGSAKSITATTTPAGHPVTVTYDGHSTAPINAGTYAVSATVNSSTATGSATATLTINKAAQSIHFAALNDRDANTGSFALSASATSGLPVSFAVTGPVMLAGNVVTLTGATGNVTIAASQAGNANYLAAPAVSRTFTVTAAGPRIFMGDMIGGAGTKIGDLAAALPPTGNDGHFVIVSPDADLSLAFDFTLLPDGTFVNVVTVNAGATAQTEPSTPPVAAAVRTLTFRGQLAENLLSGRCDEGDFVFAVPLQPRGATSGVAGFFEAPTINNAAGATYAVVGNDGEVLVLATAGSTIAGGRTTLGSDGSFALTAATANIRGAVDAGTNTVTGVISQPGAPEVGFSGVAATTLRTDRLINLSSRSRVGPSADRTLITGFVVGGTESKRVLLRAVGPTLAGFGVTGSLSNPRLQVYDAAGRLMLENDDWSGADIAAAITRTGAFNLPAGARDAALLAMLPPGAYTVHITGGGETGTALAEIYDASTNPAGEYQRLVNISSRGMVESGDGILIGGFVVSGNSPKRILVRGVGPSLASLGVTGALVDPMLTVFSGQAKIAENDNWGIPVAAGPNQVVATAGEIATAARATGAFAFANGTRDAAVVVTLAPGAYTAQVSSATGSGGVALVEIYEIPE